ncbi:hypothetical protein Q3G72_011207 [Acer saccharum]|nr:hypothetical protein Q3G72_011207 [Acer saccharum]
MEPRNLAVSTLYTHDLSGTVSLPLKETEIIESLIPSVLQNLEHRHPYIRRNAILAVMSIYKLLQGDQLLVDAIRATVNTYCQLLLSQRDNNVKLIVLDQLNELKSSHRKIMADLIMDVLRTLSSPNLDIRRKTLDIVLELITPRNNN